MSETVILALIALVTLIVTNLFALWRTSVADRAARDAAAVAVIAASQTHAAVAAIAAKVDVVHDTVLAQPGRSDLESAVAVLTAAVQTTPANPVAVRVVAPFPPLEADVPPPPGHVADTRASG